MNGFLLSKPNIGDIDELNAYKAEMLEYGSSFDGCASLESMDTAEWLGFIRRLENEATLPENFVPAEQFCCFRASDRRLLGMIQLRLYFNDFLREYGGRIGYSVRPSERNQGVAKWMLQNLLPICREHEMKKVLITCLTDNEPSRRTILANGGIYERTTYLESEQVNLERYWIELAE